MKLVVNLDSPVSSSFRTPCCIRLVLGSGYPGDGTDRTSTRLSVVLAGTTVVPWTNKATDSAAPRW
jgi:hypothetical protein